MQGQPGNGQVPIVEVGPERADDAAEVRRRFLSEHRDREFAPSDEFAVANRRWVAEGLAAGWYRAWLAESAQEVVGGVGLLTHRFPPRPDDPRTAEAWVIPLWVRSDHRRRGIATRLVDLCRSAAADSGTRRLLLWATEDGRPLYEREGFATSDWLFHLDIPD